MDSGVLRILFILSSWECTSSVPGMYLRLFILSSRSTSRILFLALPSLFQQEIVNGGRCLRCFSGKSGPDKPIQITRYVVLDIILVVVKG